MNNKDQFFDLLRDTEMERNLSVIAYSESSEIILAQNKKSGKLHYLYVVGNDCTCDYSLFSEVGEPVKPAFKSLLRRNGLTIETKETETDYFEVLAVK